MAVDPRERTGPVDLGGLHRLAERAVRGARTPAAADLEAHPALGAHWVLADHDWHRLRAWSAAGADRQQTDHHHTRYALLPDARLVRADRWRGEAEGDPAGPWESAVRGMTVRDVVTLDRPVTTAVDEHGRVRTWGTRPAGESTAPWPGAVLERLLRALVG